MTHRVDEDLHELAIGHHELGDKVDVVISVGAKRGRERSPRLELLPELRESQVCGVS